MDRPYTFPVPGFFDPFSSWLHLLGAAIFLLLTPFLVRQARRNWAHATVLFIYAFAVVFQLSMSGVFHMLPENSAGRDVLQRLDHAAIFLLIVSSFTPVYVMLFRGRERRDMLLLMWTIAITGITLKVLFFEYISHLLSLVMYLGMGWVGLFTMVRLALRFGVRFELLLILGNLAYTVSAVLDRQGWPTLLDGVFGPHEMFHVGVLMGIGTHWAFFHRIARWRSKQQARQGESLVRNSPTRSVEIAEPV